MQVKMGRHKAVALLLAISLFLSIFPSMTLITGSPEALIVESIPNINPAVTIINGDGNIAGDQTNESEVIILTGNLTIEFGGNLTFKNVTLMINSSVDGEYYIEVKQGGTFTALDLDNDNTTTNDASVITAYNTSFEYLFWVRPGSNLTMKNSELRECGYDGPGWESRGFYLNSNNITIDGLSITDGARHGIIVDSFSPTISNSSIYGFPNEGIYVINFATLWMNNSEVRDTYNGINIQQSGQAFLKDSRIISPVDDCIAIWIDSTLYMNNVTLDAQGGGNYGIAGLGLTPSKVTTINSTSEGSPTLKGGASSPFIR